MCRLDDVAEGDPIQWTIDRLRTRLPEMLDHAGASDIAAGVRADPAPVAAVVDRIHEMLSEAKRRAETRRASGASLEPSVP